MTVVKRSGPTEATLQFRHTRDRVLITGSIGSPCVIAVLYNIPMIVTTPY
jgi:hypothetical protein